MVHLSLKRHGVDFTNFSLLSVQADKLAMQKFNWNDESVARYINLYLSSMIYVRARPYGYLLLD